MNSTLRSNIIVTGGAGFIGTNLVEKLIIGGNHVTIIDNLSVSDSNIPYLKKIGAEVIIEDVSEFDKIKKYFKSVNYVFHLAAMNRAQRSIEDPLLANKWNVDGTLAVLEAARVNDVKKVINISSSSVYERKDAPLSESDNVSPLHPYGVGKLAAEHYTRIYNEIYGLDTLSLRYFSVYGPRQLGHIDKAGVIAKFIHRIIKELEIEVYGDGSQTRNFTFISDVVSATINSSKKKDVNGIINIASQKEVTVNQVVSIIEDITKKEAKINYRKRLKGDPLNNPADIKKAKKILDFNPSVDIKEGIKRTIDWYNQK